MVIFVENLEVLYNDVTEVTLVCIPLLLKYTYQEYNLRKTYISLWYLFWTCAHSIICFLDILPLRVSWYHAITMLIWAGCCGIIMFFWIQYHGTSYHHSIFIFFVKPYHPAFLTSNVAGHTIHTTYQVLSFFQTKATALSLSHHWVTEEMKSEGKGNELSGH